MFPVVDLPEPERQAMLLDGELYRLGDSYVSIAVPDAPASRAASLLAHRPRRLIAARGTAAWIWGARATAPIRGEFVVDLAARWRPSPAEGLEIVESVLRRGDVTRVGGAAVTTPLRTAVDLARFRDDFTDRDADIVRHLASVGGFTCAEAVRSMNRGRNLSGKQLAAKRLERCFAQPELTR